ncbi:MAG: TlyA family RNA methyltransferase [Deltaproteobacteria bacterium]|nr:TlyA family RNA methyltransferase [Deltaproteobacteria bacterium]
MRPKERLDRLLVERGLASSRQQARALIMAGKVVAGGNPVEKPGTLVRPDISLGLKGRGCPFVSRGGLKLEAALKAFEIDPRGKRAMDVGASTGGFTDCLLQKGAARVFAVDVGYGQLAWRLQQDPRVVNLERTNIRYLDFQEVGEPLDLIVVDTSFISVEKFLSRLRGMVKRGGDLVVLVKPQFEVGRGEVEKGGIIRDRTKQMRVVERVRRAGEELGLVARGVIESPIKGAKGNREFFVHFVRSR